MHCGEVDRKEEDTRERKKNESGKEEMKDIGEACDELAHIGVRARRACSIWICCAVILQAHGSVRANSL